MSEIAILLNNDLSDREKISNIQQQIDNYGFESTAIKFSISSTASKEGDLGWMNADSLNKNIYEFSGMLFIIISLMPVVPSGSFFSTYTAGLIWFNYSIMMGNKKIEN